MNNPIAFKVRTQGHYTGAKGGEIKKVAEVLAPSGMKIKHSQSQPIRTNGFAPLSSTHYHNPTQ